MAEPRLVVAGLRCVRGQRALFEHLDLELAGGECLRVCGANGVGKTSLLRLLCGIGHADAGRVLWRGQPVRNASAATRADILYLGHLTAIKEALTVQENLKAFCGTAEPAAAGQIIDALRAVELAPLLHRPVRTLSAGQRRRAGLARLYLSSASLWLLDEPFTALDPAGVGLVGELVGRQLARGGCVVFTAHSPDGPLPQARHLDLDHWQPAAAAAEALHGPA